MSNILIHLMLAFCELMIMDLLLQMKKFLILKKRFCQLLCISLVHCYLVAWYTVPFCSVYWTNDTPTESYFKCIGSTISTLILIGFNAFVKSALMSNHTETSSLQVSWFMTFSRYFHYLSWDDFVISSLWSEADGLVNILGRSNYSFLSSLIGNFETF